MNSVFKISHAWESRPKPLPFTPQDYVDANPVFLGLEHFLAVNTGQFSLQIGDVYLALDLRPDLSTVFERVPAVLHGLLEKDSREELYFYEQGSDLKLLLHNDGGSVHVRFESGTSASPEFRELSGKEAVVPLAAFMMEWIRFARLVLQAITALEPALSQEADYQRYNERLRAVESRVPGYGTSIKH